MTDLRTLEENIGWRLAEGKGREELIAYRRKKEGRELVLLESADGEPRIALPCKEVKALVELGLEIDQFPGGRYSLFVRANSQNLYILAKAGYIIKSWEE